MALEIKDKVGPIVVVRYDGALSAEQADTVRQHIRAQFTSQGVDGAVVLLASGGLHIEQVIV